MKSIHIILVLLCLLASEANAISSHAARQTLRRAARRSGKEALTGVSERAAVESLKHLAARHGDEVARLVRDGGLEMLDALPRHGDGLVRVSRQLTPQARRVLALNSDQLMPLALKDGPRVVELAARNPGVFPQALRLMGSEGAGRLLVEVPASDLPRVLRYMDAADNPATRELFLQAYKSEGPGLFQRIPPRLVLAGGLSASMIHGTHRVTAPAQELAQAISRADTSEVMEIAEKHVQVTRDRLSLWVLGMGIVLVLVVWRCLPKPRDRSPREPEIPKH